MDVALVKYRIAATETPNSAQLWNNIGMCFFGKGKYVAAVACLKRAVYIAPFEWIISYNLGVVHLTVGQYASAFNYFSAAVNFHPSYAKTYSYLAVALARLDDFDNSCAAYEKSLELGDDYTTRLNYAITLYLNDELERAKYQYKKFNEIFARFSDKGLLHYHLIHSLTHTLTHTLTHSHTHSLMNLLSHRGHRSGCIETS